MLMVNHYGRIHTPNSNGSLVITETLKDNKNCQMTATLLLYIYKTITFTTVNSTVFYHTSLQTDSAISSRKSRIHHVVIIDCVGNYIEWHGVSTSGIMCVPYEV